MRGLDGWIYFGDHHCLPDLRKARTTYSASSNVKSICGRTFSIQDFTQCGMGFGLLFLRLAGKSQRFHDSVDVTSRLSFLDEPE